MSCALKISEASSIAMHAMGLLALRPGRPLSSRAIARCFGISEAHLAKTLQRLAKVGLLRSSRGPKGGFSLAVDPEAVTLLQVFTAIEGPVDSVGCMFAVSLCDGQSCILGRVMVEANEHLMDHLTRTNLKEISRVFLDGRVELPFDDEPVVPGTASKRPAHRKPDSRNLEGLEDGGDEP